MLFRSASMKEGATGKDTPHDSSGYKHYRTGGLIRPKDHTTGGYKPTVNDTAAPGSTAPGSTSPQTKQEEAHETVCKIGAMTIEDFIKQYPDYNTMRVVDLVRTLNMGDIRACKYTKHKHVHPLGPLTPLVPFV